MVKLSGALTSVALILTCSSYALAHGGGLNAEGCHNNRSTECTTATGNAAALGQVAVHLPQWVSYYNTQLAAHLGGRTEVTIDFTYGLQGNTPRQASVRIDIVTDQFAIEGGLDKRSSLDSIQRLCLQPHSSASSRRLLYTPLMALGVSMSTVSGPSQRNWV